MRQLYLSTVLAVVSFVTLHAAAITQGPALDAVTSSTARVTWITDLSSTSVIKYGPTSAYGLFSTGQSNKTTHSWYISGLVPATTYHYQVCSTPPGSSEFCSADKTFTTAPPSAQTLPEPPRQTVNAAMPSGAYGPPFNVVSNCSNLTSIISGLATLSGSLNYEIVIPSGTECRGQFVFPGRPNHTGWIVVRSSNLGSTPAGVRIPAATGVNQMARFVTDALPATRLHLNYIPGGCSLDTLFAGYSAPGMEIFICKPLGGSGAAKALTALSAVAGGLQITSNAHGYQTGNIVKVANSKVGADGTWKIRVVNANQFVLEGASASGAYPGSGGTAARNEHWTVVPHTTGTTLPASCVVNSWFYKSNNPTDLEAYWCTSPNTWTNYRPIFTPSGASFSALQFAANAERYRFVGLEVTHNPVPNPPPPGWSQKDYRQGAIGSLVSTKETNRDIIIDRCNIHGLDYPARLSIGVNLEGSNVALIDSRVHKVNQWTEHEDGVNREAFAVNISYGPGPGKIENNYLEAIGITIFFPDAGSDAYHRTPAADYEIRRNYLGHPTKYLYGSAANTSRKNYMNRHHFELKRGRRMLIEGNVFDTNWADLNQGAFVMLSPRPGPVPPAKTITDINYGTITTSSSAMPFQPGMLVSLRNTGAANHDGIFPVTSVSGSSFTLGNAPAGSGTSGTAVAVAGDIQISDLNFKNNIFRNGPNVLWLIGHDDGAGGQLNTKATQRIAFLNNVIQNIDARAASAGGWSSPLSTYVANGRPGIAFYIARGVENFTAEHNTVYEVEGMSPSLLFLELPQLGTSSGLRVHNNIFVSNNNPKLIQINGLHFGTDALNLAWTPSPGTSWNVSRNVFCCSFAPSVQATFPVGNSWVASESVIGFLGAATGNFQVGSSSPFAAGKLCFSILGDCTTDGKAAGVDYPQLNAVVTTAP